MQLLTFQLYISRMEKPAVNKVPFFPPPTEFLTFPHTGKAFCTLEGDRVSPQGPGFSGMGECKRSHSRDRKTFLEWGNGKKLWGGWENVPVLTAGWHTVKKRFTSFPSPAGMSLTKLPLGRNNSVMTSLFPPRESLVVTSRVGTGNSRTFF
jgi:hypothetical protein